MGAIFDRDLYMRAWRFAAERHHGQTMSGSELPYITHIGAVAMEVIAAITSEPVENPDLAVVCALLHDTIEDTTTTRAELEATFGPGVAAGVDALSKRKGAGDPMGDSLSRIRSQPREIAMVKLADRAVNMEPPPARWNATKRRSYHAEAGTILAALGGASPFLAARLREKMDRYESFF